MQFDTLGNTDIEVSKFVWRYEFCEPGTMHDWSLSYDDSKGD